jgi:hypothetical protein
MRAETGKESFDNLRGRLKDKILLWRSKILKAKIKLKGQA